MTPLDDDEQELIAAILASTPPSDVPRDFLARVNARIDASAGWLGLVDFRLWTLRLVPAAVALALVAVFWSGPGAADSSARTTAAAPRSAATATFSPASPADWQKDVSGEALLEAALWPRGDTDVR